MSSKVLLIDDDHELLQIIKKMLLKNGYIVRTCSSGQQAFEILGLSENLNNIHLFRPDLMIIDIGLPDMLGYEFLKILKEYHSDIAEIPFIIMSGQYMEKDNILEGLCLGAYDYLSKPFDFEILLIKVRNCIDFRQNRNKFDIKSPSCEIFDIKETADFLNLTEKTVYNLVHEGKLPGLKIGGQWRFSKNSLREIFK